MSSHGKYIFIQLSKIIIIVCLAMDTSSESFVDTLDI